METIDSQRTTTPEIIQQFIDGAAAHSGFERMLLASLTTAQKLGKEKLDADLYDALRWPTDFDGYIDYLEYYRRYKPRQGKAKAWQNPENGQSQEVYDHLCHFYWLIDQPLGSDGHLVQDIEWFSDWLIDYAKDWGNFLNTTESFNQEILESFIVDSPAFRMQDSMIGTDPKTWRPNNPSGWLTFNQFFARELNPGLRPIASPTDNTVVTAPADCTYKAQYPIDADSNIKEVTMKKTHKYANVKDLLEGSEYADKFANGTFVHYFLGPYSYHRFHTPVAGFVKECYAIHGKVFLDVNLKDGQFDAPDSSEGGYEFTQSRGVIIVDTTNSPYGNVGLVAVVPIGMAQVSSVNMTATINNQYEKGEEFGYFLFGGSDNILLFQEGVNPQILTNTDYRHYGTAAAKCKTLD
jgi:phosphatidylserine decarboxylase